MTEPKRIDRGKSGDCQHLLHLSNISLNPMDIVSVYWKMNEVFSEEIVTRIRTRFEVFVLKANSPCYKEDIEALEKATGRLTQKANENK